MRRLAGVGIAAAVVLAAGVALARDVRGPDSRGAASAEAATRSETLDLRDELVAKQMDLEAEYQKAEPDPARIATLRKDIVDIRARLRAVGDRYGVRTWGRGHGRGMMYGPAGWDGCGCGHCW